MIGFAIGSQGILEGKGMMPAEFLKIAIAILHLLVIVFRNEKNYCESLDSEEGIFEAVV